MRITYRRKFVKSYWEDRWASIPADQPMESRDVYPLKYAELIVGGKDSKILEVGCGAGRLLRHYKNRGYDIVGMDYIESVIKKLNEIDPELQVEVGDIRSLKYTDESFRNILAFGVYHNLETGLHQALSETYRVLKPGGRVCASFRADNIQTRLTDWLKAYREKKDEGHEAQKHFHKINLTRSECSDLFKRAGFLVEGAYQVENMPIFYQFSMFRAKDHKIFNESLGRKEGYRLSLLAEALQKLFMLLFPDQFCNIFVIIARKSQI